MKYKFSVINDCSVKPLPKLKVERVLQKTFSNENIKSAKVNVIFVDKSYIEGLNKEFFGKAYETDVIAFSLEDDEIDGEIYICAQVAQEQAEEYNVSLNNEILRLAAHGALHLCGYEDDTEEKKEIMHKLEDKYITAII